jgi:hypothetical protein
MASQALEARNRFTCGGTLGVCCAGDTRACRYIGAAAEKNGLMRLTAQRVISPERDRLPSDITSHEPVPAQALSAPPRHEASTEGAENLEDRFEIGAAIT